MAAEKVTIMVLKVDLQCSSCYNKVKKTLCKIPQIRDQLYDEKANTVTVKVVCCCPERIRDKIYSKGGKSIKSIEIKEPNKPKEAEKPKNSEKPKSDGPTPSPKDGPKPEPVKVAEPAQKPPTTAVVAAAAKGPEKIPVGVPSVFPYMGPTYYDGYANGPYYHGYGGPPPSRPCYEGFYGNGYGYGRSYDHNYNYFSEENSQGCSIM